jgi:hypothetical protein
MTTHIMPQDGQVSANAQHEEMDGWVSTRQGTQNMSTNETRGTTHFLWNSFVWPLPTFNLFMHNSLWAKARLKIAPTGENL